MLNPSRPQRVLQAQASPFEQGIITGLSPLNAVVPGSVENQVHSLDIRHCLISETLWVLL